MLARGQGAAEPTMFLVQGPLPVGLFLECSQKGERETILPTHQPLSNPSCSAQGPELAHPHCLV